MPDHGLITIGQFARLSGLSVHSLRPYGDVGLLARPWSITTRAIGATDGIKSVWPG
jgi:hypothetical protein